MTTPTKRCPACDKTKALDDFHRCRTRKDGRQGRCKECVNAYAKTPEQRERRAATQRRYAAAHPKEVQAARARYYRENREAILARAKARRDKRRAAGTVTPGSG
jgi:hypothetical protein